MGKPKMKGDSYVVNNNIPSDPPKQKFKRASRPDQRPPV